MPFAVIKKQRDGVNLYLQGPDENDPSEMMWTPNKARACPFSTAEKAEFVVQLIGMFTMAEMDVIGLKQESVS